jgi:hypothetical protein
LQGRDAPVTLDGVVGTQALGDLSQDLVFTPVVPCRIFDTQFDGDGAIMPALGVPNNYYVYGTGALIGPQGGNPAGCPAPKGEPVGISANFTVRNPQSNGNIRPWPYLSPQPQASFLNYVPGQNLANAGIVATCYLCGPELSVVHNFGQAHSLADVMGYFYPAPIADLTDMAEDGYDLNQLTVTSTLSSPPDDHCYFVAGRVPQLTFASGDEALWNVSTLVYRSGGATNTICGTIFPAYRNITTGVITRFNDFQHQTDFGMQSTGSFDNHTVTTNARAIMPTGTYQFSYCATQYDSLGCVGEQYTTRGLKVHVIKSRN